jgi:RHS repeat-associated protein
MRCLWRIWIALTLALGFSASAASTVTYFHNDLTGSPLAATDASGHVLWRESYRPYGERLVNSASAKGNDVWFASRRQDVETGLVYMGARYYDPVAGRFVSIDPKQVNEGDVHSFSRYAYANNNPYKNVDPDGKESMAIRAQERAQIGYLRGTVSHEELFGLYRAQAAAGVAGLTLGLPGAWAVGLLGENAALSVEGGAVFRIIDGVRRAKAAELAGKNSISAEIEGGGGKITQIPIESLRSPKTAIETEDATSSTRWERAVREAADGSAFPIRVQPGTSGTPISEVKVGGNQ